MAIQWHPLFAQLLRALVEDYYDVQTNVPVGDVPREADIVLVRRTSKKALPFVGLWRHLTTWSILEYKGPTVSARLEHLDLLVELGLGIHRRLNEDIHRSGQEHVGASEVSFWYLAQKLGKRFLHHAERKLGHLAANGDGVWQGAILEHPLFLISGANLPLEVDCAPFHVLNIDSPDRGLSAARLVVNQPTLWDWYSQFLGNLHPETLQELRAMARSRKGPVFHFKPMAEMIGMKEVVRQLGLKAIIDAAGPGNVLDELLSHLTVAQRADLRRRLEQTEPRKK